MVPLRLSRGLMRDVRRARHLEGAFPLERPGRAQHRPVVMPPPDDLQPRGQTLTVVKPQGTVAAGCCVRLNG